MKRSMGSALKGMVEDEVVIPKRPSSQQANSMLSPHNTLPELNKMRIFFELHDTPALHQRALAQRLGLSNSTVAWHLKKLEAAGLVNRGEYGRKLVYYPKGFIQEGEMQLFAIITDDLSVKLFKLVTESPGGTITKMSEHTTSTPRMAQRRLEELLLVGLIKVVVDGRFKRYYPTPKHHNLVALILKRSRNYRKHLITALLAEGYNVHSIPLPDKDVSFELRYQGQPLKLHLWSGITSKP